MHSSWLAEPSQTPIAKDDPPAATEPARDSTDPGSDAEARRIATELAKLHAAGAISGPGDPEAIFYAHLVRKFEASFTGVRAELALARAK